jgi:hypothetical protein
MRLGFAVIFLCFCFVCVMAESEQKDVSGPALYVGYGNLYGGTGVRAEYQLKKANSIFTFTPTVGIGSVPVRYLDLFGWNFGFLFEVGHLHRCFLGLTYGYLEGEADYRYFAGPVGYQFSFYEYNLAVGATMTAGYKGMLKNGICWSASLGSGAVDNPLNTNRINGTFKDRLVFAYNAGIGYKF